MKFTAQAEGLSFEIEEGERNMERIYKTMRNAGVLNIAVGTTVLIIGLAAGVLSIVWGVVLLKRKSEIIF